MNLSSAKEFHTPRHHVHCHLATNINQKAPYYAAISLSYFLPLGPKYLPQHPIREHPQPIFFP